MLEIKDKKELPDLPAQLDQKVKRERLDLLVVKEMQVQQVLPDLQVQLVQLELV